jgi:two-component system sensor histidine kinase TctE
MIVADAAHQVRTPLASLRAQAELAMDETDTELLRKRVSRIHANAVAASQIVNQLLSEATVMHQQETTAPRSTDLEVLVNDMVAHMDPVEAERIVTDDSGLRDNERPMVSGTPVALRELLRNLIENALRYSEGEVRVCFAHEAGELVVRVLDRGPGIPDYEKTCLRERFWRGSASNMAQGSGLGLSIVSSVVEASGGRLEFLDREGGGLQVELHWPDRRGQR